LRNTSALVLVLLAGIAVLGMLIVPRQLPTVRLLAVLGPVVLVALTLPFMVLGYSLTRTSIEIERLGWVTSLPIATLAKVEGDAEAMQRSLRLFGNGGLFAITGLYWSRRLGRYRAFATDPSRAVVLRYPRRTVVLTPDDPQRFIVRVRNLMARGDQ
jgi:hypothetical protein